MKTELRASAPDEGTRIEILDPNLQPIPLDHNVGEVRCTLDPGVYAVRFRRGLVSTDKLVVIRPEDDVVWVTLEESEEPAFATAAPLAGSTSTNDRHCTAAERISHSSPIAVGPTVGDKGRLLLFIRADMTNTVDAQRLDAGLSLHALSGEELLRVDQLAEASIAEGWAGIHLQLSSGTYRLRRRLGDDQVVEQALYVRQNWQTQFFALAVGPESTERSASSDFARIAVLMAQEAAGFRSSQRHLRHTEAALRALRESSSIPGPMSTEMLDGKFENPMLGILAALLQLRRKEPNIASLRRVVERLLLLVGHVPDVLAVGLALMTRDPALRTDRHFSHAILLPGMLGQPPYYNESWRHIIEATQWESTLVPVESFASVVAAHTNRLTPWFQWRLVADDQALVPVTVKSVPVQLKGVGFLSRFVNNVLTAIGLTQEKLDRFSLGFLNVALQELQDTLRELGDDAPRELQAEKYTDLDRRIAYFVHPLADPMLQGLLQERPNTVDTITAAVLARGRDGRELANALQLPLGTAIMQVLRLNQKLTESVWHVPSETQILEFLDAQSQGNSQLREALEALRQIELPLYYVKDEKPLNSLQYLIMRYQAAERAMRGPRSHASRALEAQFREVATGAPATARALSQALRTTQRALAKEVSARVREEGVKFVEHRIGSPVASLRAYKSGKLFPDVVGEMTAANGTDQEPPKVEG